MSDKTHEVKRTSSRAQGIKQMSASPKVPRDYDLHFSVLEQI